MPSHFATLCVALSLTAASASALDMIVMQDEAQHLDRRVAGLSHILQEALNMDNNLDTNMDY